MLYITVGPSSEISTVRAAWIWVERGFDCSDGSWPVQSVNRAGKSANRVSSMKVFSELLACRWRSSRTKGRRYHSNLRKSSQVSRSQSAKSLLL